VDNEARICDIAVELLPDALVARFRSAQADPQYCFEGPELTSWMPE
jgi:hypothetical protein